MKEIYLPTIDNPFEKVCYGKSQQYGYIKISVMSGVEGDVPFLCQTEQIRVQNYVYLTLAALKTADVYECCLSGETPPLDWWMGNS